MILLVLCGTHFVEWAWHHDWLCQRCFGLSSCRFLHRCVEWRWCVGCRWRTISGVYLPPRAYAPCAMSLLALADRPRYNPDWPAAQELLCTPDEAQSTLEELSQKRSDSHYSKPPCNPCIDWWTCIWIFSLRHYPPINTTYLVKWGGSFLMLFLLHSVLNTDTSQHLQEWPVRTSKLHWRALSVYDLKNINNKTSC